MARPHALTDEQIESARQALADGKSISAVSRMLGVHRRTVSRTIPRMLQLKSERIIDRTRTADEFKSALSLSLRPPRKQKNGATWSLESIRSARDQQMVGNFKQAVRLAESLRTDDALFTAYHNRIAPHSAVEFTLEPASGTRGKAVARKAQASIQTPRSVLEGIHGTMANHGVAIGYIEHETNDEGTRVDFRLTEWPLEHVRYNSSIEQLETATREGPREIIHHGDGRWVVFRKFSDRPWIQEACVLPAAVLWAAHAEGIRDWAGSSSSHGLAKIFGELPEGIALVDENGELTKEAQAFLNMMQDVVSGESGAGIRPAGSKTEYVSNTSTAWQVFKELIENREKAAARIYLGTDAMLGSVGGAPGVDISALFGVATTKIQGDFEALEQGLLIGVYQPWTAINEGDSRYAPTGKYQLPDPDEDAKSEQQAAKFTRLFEILDRMKTLGFEVTQDVVNEQCALLSIKSPPKLAQGNKKTAPINLAPTDVARVVRVREARAAQGLDPLGDARDELFISELEALAQAKADQSQAGAA